MRTFAIGQLVDDRYLVEGNLGEGGMGRVLRVKDVDSGASCALKYCPSISRELRRRFRREVRIMSGIRHANVMPILGGNPKSRRPYFVMPLAANSIEAELAVGLSMNEALSIFNSMCLGAQAIHDAGSTHRDLKPANALRMQDGRVVISDLGLARLHDRDSTVLTKTSIVLGTHAYLAPEQLVGGGSRDADFRTDVFQLGKCLYELLTGETPWMVNPALIPAGLGYVIARATKQHPAQRYQSVGELMGDIARYWRPKGYAVCVRDEYESALTEVISLVERQESPGERLGEMLGLLLQLEGDDGAYMEQFERIPQTVLHVAARSVPEQLKAPLSRYAEAIRQTIDGYDFEHAETVALTMQVVFGAAQDVFIKVLALKTAMIAAVELNRFAAMGVFDQMLAAVRSPELDSAVAEMLMEELESYRRLADRVPSVKLQPAIRRAQRAAERLN